MSEFSSPGISKVNMTLFALGEEESAPLASIKIPPSGGHEYVSSVGGRLSGSKTRSMISLLLDEGGRDPLSVIRKT